MLAFGACESPGLGTRGEVLELDADTIRLGQHVAVADVLLRTGAAEAIDPDTVRIRVGDVVRFTAADARSHIVAFDRGSLAPAAVEHLERTGQLRSPPLLTTGARWIVSFEGAPPGAYTFIESSRGARGVVLVAGAARDE